MTAAAAMGGTAVPGGRAAPGAAVFLAGCMLASARVSRLCFYAGVFFVFITTTRLEIPVFFAFDKLFLCLSLAFWLLSPAPIVDVFRGTVLLRALLLRRDQLPVIALFASFAAIKAFDAFQRISVGRLNVFGLFGYAIQEMPYILLPLMLMVHVRTTRDLEWTLRIALYSIALSACVALGIYFDLSPAFLALRDTLVPPNSMFPNMGRLPFRYFQSGLAPSAYTFSYHLSLAIPATVFALRGMRGSESRLAHALLLPLFLMTLAVVGTRTPLVGCTAGILFGYVRVAKIRWRHLAGVLLAGALVVGAFAAGGLAIQERFQGENLALDFLDKFWAQMAAFVSLPGNPLGVGYGTVEDSGYVNALNADIRVVHLPHFHFITAILFWGFPGLLLSLVFCLATASILRGLAAPAKVRALEPSRRMVSAAGTAALVAGLINGMAHNPGPFFADYTSWLALGWILAAAALPAPGGEAR